MSKRASCGGLLCRWRLPLWAPWLLWVLWMFAVPQAQATPTDALVLAEGRASIPVTSGVDYLIEDPGQALTAELAMSASNASRWKRYEGRKVNLLRHSTPVWLRLRFENRASNPWVLGIDWPLLHSLHVYQFDTVAGQLIARHETGLGASGEQKALQDTGYVFPLVFREGRPTTALVRVHTKNSVIVPMTVWNRQAYQASRHNHNLLMGMLFGVLAIMLLYNASLLLFTRDRSFAYYAAYLLAATLYELAITGYGALLIWGDNPWLTAWGYEFFACFTFLAATLFIRNFLDIPQSGLKHLRWGTHLVALYWVIGIVVVLAWPSLAQPMRMPLAGALSGLFAVYVSFVQMARGNVSARYFTVAWAVLVIGTMAHMLALLGVVEGNAFTEYGQHVGFVIEILLLSVALADRIKRDRLARNWAQGEALALTRSVQIEREEKIKAQEDAIAIQTRANDELEVRVLDRTAELERAMKNLAIANDELAKLSVTDALTTVHNRRYFDEALAREHDRSARTGVPLALLLADIDHFKKINDTCGHLAGDECLRLVAVTLVKTVGRSTDLIARYGGEEFALVLPATGPDHAFEVAERVRVAVENILFIYRGRRVPITISLGVVAQVTRPEQSVSDFIAEADAALYRAKAAGRNQVMVAAQAMRIGALSTGQNDSDPV